MRMWEPGDPIEGGNDTGIPDIKYFDYLKDKSEDNDYRYSDSNYNDVGQYMSDSLLFLGKGSNGKTVAASIMFVPAGKKFKIASIAFRPVEIRKQ